MIVTRLAAMVILFTLGTLFSGCTAQGKSSPATENQIATAQRGDLRKEITPGGNLKMPHYVELTFGSVGSVQQVMVQIGDAVEQGQALARLDTLALEQSLLQAKIDVKTAKLNLERAEQPTTSGSGDRILTAPDPLDIEIKALLLERAQLRLTETQRQLDQATIMAPFAGLVSQVNVSAGDQVSASTVAVRLIDPQQLEVEALVNEMDIFQVKQGAQASVQVDALSALRLPATVTAISPTATIEGGVVNFPVKLEVKPPETAGTRPAAEGGAGQRQSAAMPLLREGLTVTVSILIEEKQNVIVVPSRAIIRQGRDTFVQVMKDGVAERRSVKTGISNWQLVEVTDGVSEGEQVVIQQAAASQTQMNPMPGGIGGAGRLIR